MSLNKLAIEEIKTDLDRKVPTTKIIRKMGTRYPHALIVRTIKDLSLASGTPFFERCQKPGCDRDVEPGRKYCSREHAPYGDFQ